MIRGACIVVFIVLCGLLEANGRNEDTVGEDIQRFDFEKLLTHLKAFEARMQEQIGTLNKNIGEAKDEMIHTTTQILRRIEGIEKTTENIESAIKRTQTETVNTDSAMYEGIDNTEGAIRKPAQDRATTAPALQNNLLALNTSVSECITKDILSRLLEDQSSRLMRRIEQTTVASGMQKITLGDKNYTVYVDSSNNHGFGGNWIVFQARLNEFVNFNRSEAEYKAGFGYFKKEHWLGLEKLYLILQTGRHELLIVLEDFDGVIAYEHYDNFQLRDERNGYEIASLGSYTGNAGHSFAPHVGRPFYTFDNDYLDLASSNAGGWWFKSGTNSFLNGEYRVEGFHEAYGLSWYGFKGFNYSLKSTKMMVRRHLH